MKIKLTIFLFLLFLIIFSLVSSSSFSHIELEEGKNIVEFNITEPIYIETLVKLNPKIDAVSYIKNGKTVGYVNFLGGIGENFIIEKNKEYEIIVRGNSRLILPSGG